MHKYSKVGIAGDRTGDLVVGRQRSYQLYQRHPPYIEYIHNKFTVFFDCRIAAATKKESREEYVNTDSEGLASSHVSAADDYWFFSNRVGCSCVFVFISLVLNTVPKMENMQVVLIEVF